MTRFSTKDEMIAAYALSQPKGLHRQFLYAAAVYVPHLYRGGWVIRGFGYSVERIGKFITREAAGNPLLV